MFGCHNCGKNPTGKIKYENSSCANCKAVKDPVLLNYNETDPATLPSMQIMHPAYEEYDSEQLKQQLFSALSRTVKILVHLKEKSPETYSILEAKMENPALSYAELAKIFSCKKQNILYHLKRAVKICPELECALLIDSRFSGGHLAFKRKIDRKS